MSAISNIVINDAQATPVAHTFAPARQSGDLVEWHDRSTGYVAGFKKLSMLTRFASAQNAGQRITIKVVDPTLAVTAPASGTGVQPNPVAAYTTLASVEFLLPTASSLQNRKDILAYVKNLLSNSQIVAAVENLDAPY